MDWISMLKNDQLPITLSDNRKTSLLNKPKKSEEFKKMELRPCHGDLELMQREKDLEQLKVRIHELERE